MDSRRSRGVKNRLDGHKFAKLPHKTTVFVRTAWRSSPHCFQLSPCSPNLLASVALTLPLPQEFFLFCRFPWDARRKGRFLGLCGPLCPCAWLVDSGFSLNTSVPL